MAFGFGFQAVDMKLAGMFAYSFVDVLMMDAKNSMIKMQSWLIGSFLIVALFACTQRLGQSRSRAGKQFLFCLRQGGMAMQLLIVFQWGVLLPFLIAWTVLGTARFREELAKTPRCIYEEAHPWLVIFWQLLSYLMVITYTGYFGVACLLEYRLRTAERHMRQVESVESLARWGHISPGGPSPEVYDGSHGAYAFSSGSVLKQSHGLTPSDIHSIPCLQQAAVCHLVEQREHCPICLSDFKEGDSVRQLTACGHCYHKGCVDLWLVRRSDCPMCKSKVQSQRDSKSQ